MQLQFIVFIYVTLALINLPASCEIPSQEISHSTKSASESEKGVLTNVNQWRHKKKRVRHKGRRKGRQNRQSTAKRYFEKQLLVRNRTLALLGAGMEKFLPNAVDLLDINPQELPGESPFQKWHNQHKNQTVEKPQGNNSISHNEPDVILQPTKLLTLDQEKTVVSGDEDDQTIEYNRGYEAPQIEDTGQLHFNFGSTLKKLLSIFTNSSKRSPVTTPCDQWMGCRKQLKQALMDQLPACPCEYPSSIFYDDKVWDAALGKHFRWRDASGERLDVYKPGADYCIRSLLSQWSPSLAVQHCCYDRHRRLLTRGSGAGTPNLVSPDVSLQLHYTMDILPWTLCKGDFTVYNRVRPPDNGNNCTTNPDNDEFKRQVHLAKYY